MRNHLCCSALVLLTVFGTGGTVAVQCRWGEGCVCLACPSGQEPIKACWQVEGPGKAMRCQSCPAGTFSDGYDSDQCRPHSSCGVLNKKVVTSGTSHSDAVCGDCLYGFHPTAGRTASTLACVRAPPAQSTHVRVVRTVDKGSTGSGGLPVNGTAVRSPEEKSTEYAVFALVPIFCVMGLLGILICNILKKKGYNCTAEKEGGDEENATPQKEGNACPYIVDDPNEDTISVLVRLITEKKENAAALEELLLEYESKQMAISKASSIKFPVLSPLTHFLSLPRLCPHQSHLHTISGLSGPRHGYCCSRCAQKKWPPLGPLKPPKFLLTPLKPPQSLLLPPLDLQKTPLLPPVDTHHSTTKISQTPRAGSGLLPEGKWRIPGEVTRSVGRFQVAQIQEQRPGSVEMTFCPESSDSDPVEDSSLLGANKSSSSSSSPAARGTQELNIRREECWVKITLPR
ncbi:tumor necrosis factor receptor superfamily member 19L isoform X1 [Oncorhynchus keta]|uniref:tumor necrosis factor receptor superfamily member 19L isoform X1 n=1 Tax=Oncorhynchus keta TaxID=8018 RepID=UPI00227BA770|nr:tumor necrosis factor receptor superfamily member 19L isoform X1 [Oncorhynchus keta]XP_052324231.1 tumor necrosis factor receptor superfamily member 19L isoform X1 [Oncorhynchus keta]